MFTFHATRLTNQELTIDLFWKLTLFWYSGWNIHVTSEPKWIEWLFQGNERNAERNPKDLNTHASNW